MTHTHIKYNISKPSRELSMDEKIDVSVIKDMTNEFSKVIHDRVPDNPDREIAIQKLIEASMWAVRAYTV